MESLIVATRESTLDKAKFNELCAIAVASNEYEAVQETPPSNYSERLKLTLEILYHQNVDTVFSRAESKIEIIFLNSLALCFIKNSMPLVMVQDVSDIMDYTSEIRKLIPQIQALAKWYKEQGYEEIDLVTRLASEVITGAMTKKERASLMRCFTTYEWLDLEGAYHLVLQAGFPHVKVDGKGIRPDLFFWIPNKADFNLVVECDGWEYHNDKASFTRDRKRDRALQDKGYQVRRFSGTEIYNDPIGSAQELFASLYHSR